MYHKNYQYDSTYEKLLSDFKNLQSLYYEQESLSKKEKDSLISINNEKLQKMENNYKKLLLEDRQKIEKFSIEIEQNKIKYRQEIEKLKKYIENLENDCRKIDFTYKNNLAKEIEGIEKDFLKKIDLLNSSHNYSLKDKEELLSSLQTENERIFNELEENKGKYHFLFLSSQEMKENYEKKIVLLEKELTIRDDRIKKLQDDLLKDNFTLQTLENELKSIKDKNFLELMEKDKKSRRKLTEKEELRRNQKHELKGKEEEIEILKQENERISNENQQMKDFYENLIEKLKLNISSNISRFVSKKIEETSEYSANKKERTPSKFIAKYI